MSEPKQDPIWLRWNFIAHFADNELSRLIGIVPLVGYLILFSDPIIENFSLSLFAGASDSEESPFILDGLAKLRLVFFGSLFVFSSNVLFRVLVPNCIQQSRDMQEFSERVVSNFSHTDIKEIELKCRDKDHIIRTDIKSYIESNNPLNFRDPITSGSQDTKMLLRNHEIRIRLLAREYWASENNSRKLARVVTLFLALGGFVMLSIPSIDIIQAVIRDLLSL
ncbi:MULTISPECIES: hypothetical protein [Halocynthiibacter]|uniref:Uncharacterized protein n=1 Tax=Halocynthiibacter halioticoli TaxID=2986804 RepID=A0AAE3LQQ7_9RHOB|nr:MULTISPECIES: hypothetical protein [Halocynthiibacter]MCV6823798.1 hypothetical protein [Halocynthiibacter halioticoli]MCW4056799.1 hypothetical protein [Halocynthiibacter sp. SDUM655004]